MAATIGEDSQLGLLCCSGHWGPRLDPPYPRQGDGSKVPIIQGSCTDVTRRDK